MPITIDRNHTLEALLEGCRQSNPKSQELLYRQFYGYAMSVCLRYTRTRDEAVEIVNDVEKVDLTKSFKNWLRRIMVNTALDYYRQNHKHYNHDDIQETEYMISDNKDASSNLCYEELLGFIQKLSPAYRMVFSLFVIDGYSHEEVGDMLNISIGTSKSNLARARINLREMLSKE
jgi:RNA polymerase sigma factor (sigma-70 family)